MAARILDLVGIVCNRNTIPGDPSAFPASGIRLGTPWITQRGFREPEIDRLANVIADVLLACKPFSYLAMGGKESPRAKIDFDTLCRAQQEVLDLADSAGIDYAVPTLVKYPKELDAASEHFYVVPETESGKGWRTIDIYGDEAREFLDVALTSNVLALNQNEYQPTRVLSPGGEELAVGVLHRLHDNVYHLQVHGNADLIAGWLRSLSDGFVDFDPRDVFAKAPGPVSVTLMAAAPDMKAYDAIDWKDADRLATNR